MLQSKHKALTEKLFLVDIKENSKVELEREFHIMGSTGNVYTVIIKNNSNCQCPDFRFRKNICKHLYFVYIKVLKSKGDFPKILNNQQLETLFYNLENITNNLYANEEFREAYINRIKNEAKTNINNNLGFKEQRIDESCPICMEDFASEGEDLDYCKFGCGKSVHNDCFIMWKKKNIGNCVFCRTDWEKVSSKKKNKSNGKYINLYEETQQEQPKRNYTINDIEENQDEIQYYKDQLIIPEKHMEVRLGIDYFKVLEIENIIQEGQLKRHLEIDQELEQRWDNLDRKKRKEFEELEMLEKKREKIEIEIKDKFLNIKRNFKDINDQQDLEQPSKGNKRRKK